MRGLWIIASGLVVSALSGCGENCESTCTRVYDPSECGVVLPGVTPEDLITTCVSECEDALQRTGELRFDPKQTPAADDAWRLQNEAEAAAWMDCVWEQAPGTGPSKTCANIDPQQGGICAPI